MNINVSSVILHVILWIILLSIPALSSFQVLFSMASEDYHIPITPFILNGMVIIGLFYFNYFILAPKFLVSQRYFVYLLVILASIALCIFIFYLVLSAYGFTENVIGNIDPNLLLLKPVIRTNILLTLLLAMIISIVLSLNNHLRAAEKEKISAQLFSLKAQINPHFMFNVLNSIYANTLEESPRAADMIEKLSEIMRYSMKEHLSDHIELSEEFDYLKNFIELQKMRLDKHTLVDYSFIGHSAGLKIAPMMLIPFIENAFKHGVNGEEDSKINIDFTLDQSQLTMEVTNRIVEKQSEISEVSGLGIANTQKRLAHAYPDKHELNITDSSAEFVVELTIDLS